MATRIRLQRHGKKGKPFYWIVAADARSKRDGKYLEKLGTYNPNFNPAKIEINIDGTVQWLQNGAQPTDTAKSILSYKGILLKNHLIGGVRKGALTEDQAEAKFQAWVEEKSSKIDAKKSDLEKAKDAEKAKIFEITGLFDVFCFVVSCFIHVGSLTNAVQVRSMLAICHKNLSYLNLKILLFINSKL